MVSVPMGKLCPGARHVQESSACHRPHPTPSPVTLPVLTVESPRNGDLKHSHTAAMLSHTVPRTHSVTRSHRGPTRHTQPTHSVTLDTRYWLSRTHSLILPGPQLLAALPPSPGEQS